ncbi:BGTF surface domain-containing protein [Halobaculum sp. EA56]|uniref:DUF7827 domain-containing protein n=1 Tax=Halobaculum sp. EA56 TaxID=3421648 RepID=UPI003EBD299B
MTDTNDKIRALFLTALMVFSVFAGTVAFTGAAAAANTEAGGSSISPDTVPEQSTNTHTVTLNATDVDTSGDGNQVFAVDLPDALGTSSTQVTNIVVNEGAVTAGSTNVDSTNDIITVTLEDATSMSGSSSSDTVNVTFDITNVVAPETTGSDFTGQAQFAVDANADGDYADSDDSSFANFQQLTVSETTTSSDADRTYLGGDTLSDGAIVYQGQEIIFDTGSDSDGDGRYILYSGNPGSDATTETVLTGSNPAGNISVDTTNLDSSTDYFISNNGRSSADFNFTVIEQSFSVSLGSDTVGNQGTDATTTFEVSSDNRPSENFDVYVSADGISDEDLRDVFDDSYTTSDADVDGDSEDDDDGILVSGVQDGDEATINFTDVEAGSYNLTVDVVDTTAEDEVSVTVEDTSAGAADLPQRTVQVQQGDIASINVSVTGATDSAKLVVGNFDDDGYQANISVTDGDDDGNVEVEFNTYTAGMTGSSTTIVSAVDSDDSATLENKNTGDYQTLGTILDTGQYRMFVGTSSQFSTIVDTPDQVGTLVINERSTDSMQLWTAPTNAEFDSDDSGTTIDADEVASAVESGTVTQDSDIALQDYVVHQVSASGLEGALASYKTSSNSWSDALASAIGAGVVDLTVVQQNPGANRAPKVLNVSSSGTSLTVVPNANADTYYILVKATNDQDWERAVSRDNLTASGNDVDVAADESYQAELTVTGARILGGAEDTDGDGVADDSDLFQSVNATFELSERTLEFDQDAFSVTAATNQSITGTSSVAPGTEITVRLSSDSGVQPAFFKQSTVTVQADGSFTAMFDMTSPDGISAGDTFSVDASGPGGISASADGNVVEATQTTEPPATTTAPPATTTAPPATTTAPPATTTAPPTTMATTEPPATETESPTSTSTPGFGAVLAVIALIGAALLAVRRDN